MKLRVWAPAADRVDVQISGHRLPMAKIEKGYWELETPLAKPTTDYFFVLDDNRPLPDPRSAYQPQGVHGPSRLVDHSQFDWRDGDWNAPQLPSAVIYELHIGTFTTEGTFDAAIDRLNYLVQLGVTHVELMPVGEFSGDRGWGYDGVDLFAPHRVYGGPDGLKRLVNACHRRGLAVLLDVVYNHFGPSGNYLSEFGPYLTKHYATPWGDAVNFDDRGSDEVRRYFCDNAKMWLRDYHIDGLRLDAIHAIVDTSACHILEQLAAEVADLSRTTGRRLVLIAESDLNNPRIINSPAAGGYGIDAQWSDDFHHALHTVLTRESAGYYADFGSIGEIAKALRQAFVYDGQYSRYRDRVHGRRAIGLPGNRFLGYLQNHDQVGNRARGDRSSSLMNERRLRIGAALVMTAPFIPMLFQGEEWGASTPFIYFTGHEDEELGRAVSEGRKREFVSFGWRADQIPDPQSLDSFMHSKLNWREIDGEPHRSLLEWHRDLIKLRKQYADLHDGRFENLQVWFDEESQWLLMTRGSIAVACNFASEPRRVAIPWTARRIEMTSDPATRLGGEHVELPAESVAIVTR
jgi:maltooligosyltrehalose trehalohydrolase